MYIVWFLFQIYKYVHKNNTSIFFLGTIRNEPPCHLAWVQKITPQQLELLNGVALIYKKNIIVLHDSYNTLHNSNTFVYNINVSSYYKI